MTNENLKPQPQNATIVDDNGAPFAAVNVGQMQADSIGPAFDIARHCQARHVLDQVSMKWLSRIGHERFGLVAANALWTTVQDLLDLTLTPVDNLSPGLYYRPILDDAYRNVTGNE
ncbi:hypothetical protein [Rhodococcus xishaensis]|uniref:Uncharacterized protein n=1 Tax=Rhodococcus xishaensis TaxID=2487364 RepID=A0A438ARJ2_9NOCA|nr:hypothetical protein [Rhodococcus xishaensis]RVW01319.1 hypothetical protein EGT50_13975 [Rhodococcus xishaensis]